MGLTTRYTRDSVGRVTVMTCPISISLVDRDVVHYDLADRVLADTTSGPAMNGAPAESVFVRNFYDRGGNVDSTTHAVGPNQNSIALLRTKWARDAVGRTITETQPDRRSDSYVYDEDGLTLPRFYRHLNNPGSRFGAEVCDTVEAKSIPVRGEPPRTRRRFTQEFKLEAVRLASSGARRPAEVARELGIRSEMLPQWRWQRRRARAARSRTCFQATGS